MSLHLSHTSEGHKLKLFFWKLIIREQSPKMYNGVTNEGDFLKT